MASYTFGAQYTVGAVGEQALDQYFSRWYDIKLATRDEQRRGIDRVFVNRQNGQETTVEYKTDITAGRTGNAFVETVSVDTIGKPGWAYTCQARILIYHIPDPETIYVLPMARIRQNVDAWRSKYPERRIPNLSAQGNPYNTVGVLVPLDEFERIALTVY